MRVLLGRRPGTARCRKVTGGTLELTDLPSELLDHISSFVPPTYNFSKPPTNASMGTDHFLTNLRGDWIRDENIGLHGAYELRSGKQVPYTPPLDSDNGFNLGRSEVAQNPYARRSNMDIDMRRPHDQIGTTKYEAKGKRMGRLSDSVSGYKKESMNKYMGSNKSSSRLPKLGRK